MNIREEGSQQNVVAVFVCVCVLENRINYHIMNPIYLYTLILSSRRLSTRGASFFDEVDKLFDKNEKNHHPLKVTPKPVRKRKK